VDIIDAALVQTVLVQAARKDVLRIILGELLPFFRFGNG
jgi:hypothetical protein